MDVLTLGGRLSFIHRDILIPGYRGALLHIMKVLCKQLSEYVQGSPFQIEGGGVK